MFNAVCIIRTVETGANDMNAITKYLEGPNYIPLLQYDDGSVGVLETGAITKIEDCVEHIELAIGFISMESGIGHDVSVKVAELWWAANRDDCENMFDVPEFIHEHLHNDVYDDIAARKYNVRCARDHERGVAS